jgi:hypothetical protein
VSGYESKESYDVYDAMELYGGGFVKHLGALWRRADRENWLRLMTVFQQYWEEYEQVVELKKREAAIKANEGNTTNGQVPKQ